MRADNYKHLRVLLSAGLNQVVLAGTAGVRRELKYVQLSSSANTLVELYKGATNDDSHALGPGYLPANGGSNLGFNGHGAQLAAAEDLTADIVGAASVRIYVVYEEQAV